MITDYHSQKEKNKKYDPNALFLFRGSLINDSRVNPTDTIRVCVVLAVPQLGKRKIHCLGRYFL